MHSIPTQWHVKRFRSSCLVLVVYVHREEEVIAEAHANRQDI
jgi:hypothetical protein